MDKSDSMEERPVATAARGRWGRAKSQTEASDGRVITLTGREDREERSYKLREEEQNYRHHEDWYKQKDHSWQDKSYSDWSNRGGKGGSKGASRHSDLSPPPRPGFDEDKRLQKLEDDPRYKEGSELGKAQLAALGVTGLKGRNTASFKPEDTLVRPGMRVIYGVREDKFDSPVKPDDVITVPEFLGAEGDLSVFKELSAELETLLTTDEPMAENGKVAQVVSRICRYFNMKKDGLSVQVLAVPKGGKSMMRTFGGEMASGSCSASVVIGAMYELAFCQKKTKEILYFPVSNGTLLFIGRDMNEKWFHGPDVVSAPPAGSSIILTVTGRSAYLVDEEVLTEPQAAPPCRDFKLGRCQYGDRCRFSHEEAESRGPESKPKSWPARPSMRIITVPAPGPDPKPYARAVSHDDVIVVPEFICKEDDWGLYYQLIKEVRESQAAGLRNSEWLSWHEGAHLLSKNPTGSKTFEWIQRRMCDYFSVAAGDQGTRFNWYRDASDWKPFHHDSAAFNPDRAKNQNCTIGISFGAARELAFRHAKTGELIYFPQRNGMLFYFGRDANIIWQHGINALPKEEQDGKGRISIILWGKCTTTFEEAGSPPMLTDESRANGTGWGHDIRRQGPGSNDRRGACRDYQKGSCSRGERCRFSHEGADNSGWR